VQSVGQLSTKYYSADRIEKDGKGGACSMHGGCENCIKMLIGKPEENTYSGPPFAQMER
jgi:hypothetical protein